MARREIVILVKDKSADKDSVKLCKKVEPGLEH